jgi:hypothetical protein
MNELLAGLQIINDFSETIEKLNFLSWYRGATAEDFEMARKNNSGKLDALMAKYSRELDIMGRK